MTPGNKIAKLGEHFRLTQESWAEILGINRNTLASYKNRPNASPRTPFIREVAERFGIGFGWFYNGEDDEPPVVRDHIEAEKTAKISAQMTGDTSAQGGSLGVVRTGDEATLTAIHPDQMTYEEEDFASPETVGIWAWQGTMAGLDETHFIELKKPTKIQVPAFFFSRKKPDRFIIALPKGKSMIPRIVSPDRVISLLTPEAPPNSIVVARSHEGVNFIKVLRQDREGNKSLHSINKDYPPITNLEDWTLRAVVVGIWKPYEQDGPNIEFNGGLPLRA